MVDIDIWVKNVSTPESRTSKSAYNAGVSIITQIAVILLGFATRTVFISQLGVSLVGVNAVLTSVLAMLALADLGISGALMYALYAPLQKSDTNAIAAIVRYAGRMFRWVALAVATAGLALLPFIESVVNLEEGVKHLQVYYLVLLADTVVGYLMLNRLVLLNADQKIYLTKTYSLIFNILRSAAQIASLLWVGSFVLFLAIQVVFTITNNLFVYVRTGKIYPFLKEKESDLGTQERSLILSSTRAMLLYRLGGLVLTNSTPLLISVVVGTLALGYYSNYMLIIGAAVMIVEVMFSALTPSVGNLVVSGSRVASRKVFDEMVLMATLVHGTFSVALLVLIDDFVMIWLGEEFVLPKLVVVAIVLNFYISGVLMPLWSFRSATGLFRETRYIMLFTSAISIVMAVTLGAWVGMFAVIAAPTIARLMTGAWYEPWLLIRGHLAGKVLPYFMNQILAFLFWCAVAFGMSFLDKALLGSPAESLLWRSLILLISLPIVCWLAFARTAPFKSLVQRLRQLFQNSLGGRP